MSYDFSKSRKSSDKTEDKSSSSNKSYQFGADKFSQKTDQSTKQAQSNTDNDAAQSFLDKKLKNNKFATQTNTEASTGSRFDSSRYTSDQLKRLENNGGPTVANAAADADADADATDGYNFRSQYQDVVEEGTLGGAGNLEERYQKAYGSNARADLDGARDAGTANAIYDKIKALEDDSYWSQQDLSSLMKQAGHRNHQVNIGNYVEDGGLTVDASIANGINFSNIQSQIDEKGWNGEKHNSIGQLGDALLQAGGTGGRDERKFREKIQHSPEIEQAKERVRTYENDVLSGKTSDDIYGRTFTLDTSQGLKGINFDSSKSKHSSKIAAASFLDHKKKDLMQ